jgi:amidase
MRRFLSFLILLAATRVVAASSAVPIEEATIADLQTRMQSGALTSRALTEAYLARIRKLDPLLRSVIVVNPDALAIASALDRERKDKGPRGPLHGIPVLVKDNLATGDKMPTTAGSLALAGVRAPKDSTVVARLRAAGAVILGKTNLSEWANIRSSRSSSGWSAIDGQAVNPYALDRSPCGSSAGTGVSIAASLAAAGIGTETDGSIVCPSAHQALVGIKPTVGLVSRAGIVPISHTQDTAGPMARTVADAALILAAIAGPDAADPATSGAKVGGYTGALVPDGLAGMRIGVVRAKMFGQSPAADRVTEAVIKTLKARGAEIVDPADIPHLGEYDEAELDVLLTELKVDLAKYLGEWAPGATVKTLDNVIAFNRTNAAKEMPFFAQELFEQAAKKGDLDDPAYLASLERCRKLARIEGLDAVFAQYRLDALVAPTAGPPWLIDLVTGDHFGMSSSTPAAVAGYPAITVPAGTEHGLPMGVTFMGPAWSEATLIRIAYAFEQATHARRPPRFLKTADLTGPASGRP